MAALYDQHTGTCFPPGLAKRAEGEAAAAANLKTLEPAWEDLKAPADAALAAVVALPGRRDDLAALDAIAQDWRRRFDDIVVIGTGGSSLGGRALTALAHADARPRTRFCDNLDAHTLEAMLAEIDPARTGFLVISKSGSTADVMVQALLCFEVVAAAVDAPSKRFLAICAPGSSPLRTWAGAKGFRVLDHDPDLGGRYSVLSAVGLLPAMMAGLDGAAVRAGAAQVLDATLGAPTPGDAPAAVGAAIAVAWMQTCGAGINVLMPYADRLEPFALWYCQLWAESLGKGGQGSTPIRAVGPVDQHSQLQLYLDGPADKSFTLLFPETAGAGPVVPPAAAAEIGADYLGGATAGDLVAAQQAVTALSLVRHARPTRVLSLPRLDERVLGALFMHFMLETVLAAHLLGVTPFGQPAVEEGKETVREILRRPSA